MAELTELPAPWASTANYIDDKKIAMLKKASVSLEPRPTDQQLGMLTIIPNEQAVSETQRDTETLSTILQSWLTDSSWIQLIHWIKWIWYQIEKTRLNG